MHMNDENNSYSLPVGKPERSSGCALPTLLSLFLLLIGLGVAAYQFLPGHGAISIPSIFAGGDAIPNSGTKETSRESFQVISMWLASAASTKELLQDIKGFDETTSEFGFASPKKLDLISTDPNGALDWIKLGLQLGRGKPSVMKELMALRSALNPISQTLEELNDYYVVNRDYEEDDGEGAKKFYAKLKQNKGALEPALNALDMALETNLKEKTSACTANDAFSDFQKAACKLAWSAYPMSIRRIGKKTERHYIRALKELKTLNKAAPDKLQKKFISEAEDFLQDFRRREDFDASMNKFGHGRSNHQRVSLRFLYIELDNVLK